jgi:hypothetical protein
MRFALKDKVAHYIQWGRFVLWSFLLAFAFVVEFYILSIELHPTMGTLKWPETRIRTSGKNTSFWNGAASGHSCFPSWWRPSRRPGRWMVFLVCGCEYVFSGSAFLKIFFRSHHKGRRKAVNHCGFESEPLVYFCGRNFYCIEGRRK